MIVLFVTIAFISAQDTLYIYKSGVVISRCAVNDLDSISFTYSPPETGTLTDVDGNLYHWIKIGTQRWMVENLKTTKFRTGESITNLTDASAWSNASFAAWCDYYNVASNGVKYGKLYNWNAVNDSRKIAPTGWHIPSDNEWTILENYVIASGNNYDGSTTENKIAKALAAKSDWVYYAQSETGAVSLDLTTNNKTGFTALPAGDRSNMIGVSFELLGYSACWWSSTVYDLTYVWCRSLTNNMSSVYRDYYSGQKQSGHSVRCIKD